MPNSKSAAARYGIHRKAPRAASKRERWPSLEQAKIFRGLGVWTRQPSSPISKIVIEATKP